MRMTTRKQDNRFKEFLGILNRFIVGIVYSFEPSKNITKIWYDKWRTDVISSYGYALENLGATPYYIDVDSFCRQASSSTLPLLDCIFNLNAGITPISNWAFVPSVARWHNIPTCPCESDTIIIGESKDISYLIAKEERFNIPNCYSLQEIRHLPLSTEIIKKPLYLGGSVGIELIKPSARLSSNMNDKDDVIYEEFISGYDLTVPVVFNPMTNDLSTCPAILYLPSCRESHLWFHNEKTKRTFKGYKKKTIILPNKVNMKIQRLAQRFNIQTFCRLDFRLKRTVPVKDIRGNDISSDDIFFMEINPMPTLRFGINMLQSIEAIDEEHALYPAWKVFSDQIQGKAKIKSLAFLLAIAMFVKSKPSIVYNGNKSLTSNKLSS
jgi:hypothetical protein